MATHRARRSPAQWFCLVGGLSLVAAGVLGFVVDSSFETGGSVQGEDLIVFEVNGWHNLVHIATGLLLLVGAWQWALARAMTLVFAGGYALVTLIGLIDGEDVLGLFPVNGPDNVLHIALTALAVLAALLPSYEVRHDVRDREIRTSGAPGARTTGPGGRVVNDRAGLAGEADSPQRER